MTKNLNEILIVPWEDLPLQHPSLKTGFPCTCQVAIKDYLFEKLKENFPEINNTSNPLKEIIRTALFKAVIDANNRNLSSQNPTKNQPTFLKFGISLQTQYVLIPFKPTMIDKKVCREILEILHSLKEYKDFRDEIKLQYKKEEMN